MFKLNTLFPTLSLSSNPLETDNNQIKRRYVDAAHSYLKEQLVTNQVFFPRKDLPQQIVMMLGEVLSEFDKMVIYLTDTLSGEITTLSYDSNKENLDIRVFGSYDKAVAFHYKIKSEDVSKVKVDTQKVF
jgi:hypothetical protein